MNIELSKLLQVLRCALAQEDGTCLDSEVDRDLVALTLYDAIIAAFRSPED